mmetsp:Transcript_76800/g.207000  ORF Transcript_76800/g.207000 Transcript_76800/m.207000 type:complete len:279 (+) Transcript_76800:182-1018(+)
MAFGPPRVISAREARTTGHVWSTVTKHRAAWRRSTTASGVRFAVGDLRRRVPQWSAVVWVSQMARPATMVVEWVLFGFPAFAARERKAISGTARRAAVRSEAARMVGMLASAAWATCLSMTLPSPSASPPRRLSRRLRPSAMLATLPPCARRAAPPLSSTRTVALPRSRAGGMPACTRASSRTWVVVSATMTRICASSMGARCRAISCRLCPFPRDWKLCFTSARTSRVSQPPSSDPSPLTAWRTRSGRVVRGRCRSSRPSLAPRRLGQCACTRRRAL